MSEQTTAPIQESVSPEENSEESSTAIEQASAQKEAAKAQQAYFNKLKLKLDGKEVEEELPFELPDDPKIRDYLTRELQLARTGQIRMQENTQLQQEVAQFIEMLRTNPKQALRHPGIGVDVKKLAAEILEEEIENSKKSPEQIERERLEAELKELKEQREREKKENDERMLQQQVDLEFQKYDDMIDKALDKTTDLPKSPYVVKKITDYLLLGIEKNLDVTAEDVLPLVKQEIQQDIKDMFGAMPDEVVEAFLGKERINGMRKKALAKAKTAPKPLSKLTADVSKSKDNKTTTKPMTYKDFFKI